MLLILLAALGVPLWLVVGMALGAFYSRYRFRRLPGVFRCKLRLVSGTVPSLKDTWKRVPVYGRWVHDVLLVHRGLALIRVLPIPAAGIVTGPDKAAPAEVKGLGPDPRVVTLRVDGGSSVELAAGEPDELRMLGPFADTPVPPAPDH